MICALVGSYCLSLLAKECMWAMRYSETPPHLFAALLDPQKRGAALQKLELAWACWLDAEAAAAQDSGLKQVLESFPWVSGVWCREVMIALDECCFKTVPEDTLREIRDFMRACARRKWSKTRSTFAGIAAATAKAVSCRGSCAPSR